MLRTEGSDECISLTLADDLKIYAAPPSEAVRRQSESRTISSAPFEKAYGVRPP